MKLLLKALVAGAILTATAVSAHTVQIAWRCEGDGSVTFYAGNYHGAILTGGLVIDGTVYSFTSVQTTAPVAVDGVYDAPSYGRPERIRSWLEVNVVGLSQGSHSVTTTCTSAIECPWPRGDDFPVAIDPGCIVHTDGDGIPDDQDDCPDSDLGATVVIDGCDTGVANVLFDDGCTISDLLAACEGIADNHGDYVSCVAFVTNELKKDGVISGKDKGKIQSCAAKSSIGK